MEVSPLPKTWLIDVDGTIFRHNGHLAGEDMLLPGVGDFMSAIPPQDLVILLTARGEALREVTEAALARYGIRFDALLCSLPVGERILINDRKPSGLAMAHAVNIDRDAGLAGLIGEIQIADI